MKLLLDNDPIVRTQEVFHADGGRDEFHVQTTQDVTDILDLSKAQYKESGGERFGLRAQVARIPMVVWGDLVRKGIAYNTERLKAWLNDSDNQAWRTRPGKV